MANENILKSYLTSIGYKIDEDSYRKFRNNLAEASKRATEFGEKFEKLATIAAGVATELAASFLKISSTMDRLYFASQRTGASAKNIQALEYGAQQIGISAETARSALEGMAGALRTSPGLVGFLKSLNINPNKDKVEVLIDLIDRLRQMSAHGAHYQAAAYASMFGIDEPTLVMMEKNFDQLKAAMEANKKVNPIDDEKVKRFHDFMEQVRELTNKFEILANIASSRLLPVGEEIVSFLNQTADALIAADKATNGWSTTLLTLGGSIASVVGGLTLLKNVLSILGIGGAAGAAGGAGAAAAGGGIGAMLLKSGPLAAGVLGGLLARWGINIKADEYKTRAGADYASVIAGNKQAEAFLRQYKQATGKEASDNWRDYAAWLKATGRIATAGGGIVNMPTPGTGAPTYTSQLHNPGNLREWGNTPQVQVGNIGKFAKFNSDIEGLSAMAGNLLAYSRRGINTIGTIVSRWAPRSENDTASYIADVSKRMGMNAGQGLDLTDPNTLQNLMTAMIHHEQGRNPYNASLIHEAATYRLGKEGYGGGNVKIDQKTEINVNGSGDPRSVGNHVLKGQKDVNADIVRNMSGVVR